MASLNRVQIIGHLGRDPEVKSFQNGGKVVNLRVAVTESWRDKNSGERKERTEWVTVAIHAEHAAKYAEQYLRKGSQVYVEGKLETRKWEKDGKEHYSTEVVIRPYGGEIQGLDKREGDGQRGGGNGGGGRDDDRGYQRPEGNSGGSKSSGGGYGGGRASDIDDDEIPF